MSGIRKILAAAGEPSVATDAIDKAVRAVVQNRRGVSARERTGSLHATGCARTRPTPFPARSRS